MHSTRRLGSSDLDVGPVSYGCWRFAGTAVADARTKIECALDHGMNLIDTADIYGFGGPGFGEAEALLGAVLRDAPALRDRMVLATKGGIDPGVPYDSSPQYLTRACDASRARLGTDVIDLYQVHRPDLLAHPAAVAEALAGLVERGWVRHVGVSNYTPSQLDALLAHARVPVVSSQPEFSLWHLDPMDDGVLDRCAHHGITPLAWSPLGGGTIAQDTPVTRVLDEVASDHGTTRTAVALAFVLGHPSRPVAIIGTQQTRRIAEAAAAPSVELSRAEMYRLIAAAGRPLP